MNRPGEGTQRLAEYWQAMRIFATGVPGGPKSVPIAGSTVLILPLWGLLAGLVGAGVLLAARELSLLTMPYESTQTLHDAQLLGCFAGATAVVLGVAALTRGWRLVALAHARGWSRTATAGVMVLPILGLQIGLLGWLAMSGHGTLAVVSSQFGAQFAGLWALWWLARDPGGEWRPAPPRIGPRRLLMVTALAGLVPLLILILDDDPRRRMLPYALGGIPAAVGAGLLATGLLGQVRCEQWSGLGPAIELATLTVLAVLVLGA